MAKKIVLLFLTVLVLLCFPVSALAADIPKTVLKTADSVYYVEVSDGQSVSSGTAFIIKVYSDGVYLITNNHVVQSNVRNVSVWINENEKTSAEVIKYSETYDLALLKVAARDSMREVTFSDKFERGQSVYAIGFPAAADVLSSSNAHVGKDATITDGVISNIRTLQLVDNGPEISVLQINADLNFGNSGGPLVDSRGHVIGINTFGVEDSQGIFGSISVTELEKFMEGTGFALRYAGFPVLTVVILAAGVVIVFFAVYLILRLMRRKRAKGRGNFKKGILLDNYMEEFSDKLNPKSITSLMMPVAVALRDKHLRGELSLKLSPKYIRVTEKGGVLNDKVVDDGFIQQRFLSPEQLNNKAAGIYSDIYSFCVLLDYMLSKAGMNEEAADTASWKAIVEKGMSDDPAGRYGSMQELIYALSPYNSGLTKELFTKSARVRQKQTAVISAASNKNAAFPPLTYNIENTPEHEAAQLPEITGAGFSAVQNVSVRKRRSKAFKFGLAAALLIVAVAIYGGVSYTGARINISNRDFKTADMFLNLLLLDDQLLKNDRAYVNAGLDLRSQRYDEAVSAFSALGALYDSEELVKESNYQKAGAEANKNNYDAAIAMYQRLGNYKNSVKLINDTIYNKGYYLIKQKKYDDAIATFKSLMDKNYEGYDEIILDANYQCACSLIADKDYFTAYDYLSPALEYKDTKELLSQVKSKIYKDAIEYYHQKQYTNAFYYFDKIRGYMRSGDYIVLCNAHSNINQETENTINKLAPLIGFEDAADFMVSNQEYGVTFLKGTWKGDGHYIKIKKDGTLEHDVFYYSDGYYRIENGYFYKVDKNGKIISTIWTINIRSKDFFVIHYKDKFYSFYRQ